MQDHPGQIPKAASTTIITATGTTGTSSQVPKLMITFTCKHPKLVRYRTPWNGHKILCLMELEAHEGQIELVLSYGSATRMTAMTHVGYPSCYGIKFKLSKHFKKGKHNRILNELMFRTVMSNRR